MEEEKLGTMVIDGKIYNLDDMSSEDLEKLEEKLAREEAALRKQIDELLEVEEDN